MIKDYVFVDIDMEGDVVRIFRTRSAASRCIDLNNTVVQMDYNLAVGSVRHSLFVRSDGFCELCASPITEQSGHMHEQKHRGKGGEISLENSVFICPTCHRRAHADRNTRFSSSKPPESRGFVTDNIKDGETVCRHGGRPFDCRICTGRSEKT